MDAVVQKLRFGISDGWVRGWRVQDHRRGTLKPEIRNDRMRLGLGVLGCGGDGGGGGGGGRGGGCGGLWVYRCFGGGLTLSCSWVAGLKSCFCICLFTYARIDIQRQTRDRQPDRQTGKQTCIPVYLLPCLAACLTACLPAYYLPVCPRTHACMVAFVCTVVYACSFLNAYIYSYAYTPT